MGRVANNMRQNKNNFKRLRGMDKFAEDMRDVAIRGKKAMDELLLNIGRDLAEAIMHIDREVETGEDYHPKTSELKKWGSQPGSVYIGRQKIKVNHPRMRNMASEVYLKSYKRLQDPKEFSEEMLAGALRGISARKYNQTVTRVADDLGISASSISTRMIEATTRKLREFQERDLKDFKPFAVFLDTIHRGGRAFVVGLGIDINGQKKALGLWEGATEDSEVAKSLLSDLDSRNLTLTNEVLYVTDGGKGIIRALKDKAGKDMFHQRCTIHKDRNIQRHLPKKYRKESHRRFTHAIAMTAYDDAKASLNDFHTWLNDLNLSAANSLNEAKEEILTLHKLEVGEELRGVLHSTNCIESMFATVRHCEKNIKRYRSSKMSQRWLASVCLYAEESFRTVKGYGEIPKVMSRMRRLRQRKSELKRQDVYPAIAVREEVLEPELAGV